MHQQNVQSQSEQQLGSFKFGVNLSVWFAETLSLPIEVLLHEHVGCRFVRMRGPMAAGVVLGFMLLFPGENPLPLLLFLALFIARCLAHSFIWSNRLRRGVPLPRDKTTYFPGEPSLCRLFRHRSVEAVRRAEVVLVMLAGIGAFQLNQQRVGVYFMFASLGLGLTLYVRYLVQLNRLLDAHDAMVLARISAEGVRRISGQ